MIQFNIAGYFNVIIDLISLLILAVLRFGHDNGKKLRNDDILQKLFHTLLYVVAGVLLLDILSWLFDGAAFRGARVLLWVVNSGYYAGQNGFLYILVLFACRWSFRLPIAVKRAALLLAVPLLAVYLLIGFNVSSHWLFYFDGSNHYVRGSMFYAGLIAPGFYAVQAMLVALYSLRRSQSVARRRQSLSVIAFMLLPFLGALFQVPRYGISMIWPLAALSLMMVSFNIRQKTLYDDLLHSQERERKSAQTCIALTLAQLQPHFMYNVLTVIHDDCTTDPAQAKVETELFSSFLHYTMDSLSMTGLIPFSAELEQIRTFLALEQLRFEDKLNVRWEIETCSFLLPPLSVQPIVAVAITGSLGTSSGSFTLTISTREYSDRFEVIVSDDGPGYGRVTPEGRAAMAQIRERLATAHIGSLTLLTQKTAGGAAVLRIPKAGSLTHESSAGCC